MFDIIEKIYLKSVGGIKESWLSSSSSEWFDYIRSLPEGEQVAYTVVVLHNQVMNGGFHQYFVNGYGQFAQEAISNLNKIGAHEEAELLHKALNLVKPSKMDMPLFRKSLLERAIFNLFVGEDLFEPLDKLDQEYYKRGDSVLIKLEKFLANSA